MCPLTGFFSVREWKQSKKKQKYEIYLFVDDKNKLFCSFKTWMNWPKGTAWKRSQEGERKSQRMNSFDVLNRHANIAHTVKDYTISTVLRFAVVCIMFYCVQQQRRYQRLSPTDQQSVALWDNRQEIWRIAWRVPSIIKKKKQKCKTLANCLTSDIEWQIANEKWKQKQIYGILAASIGQKKTNKLMKWNC